MPKKKKFIDPKHAVTFHLVHRSQQDPLAADEKAPQFVLVPAEKKQNVESEKRKEEQRKYGVYFDDNYDYLQHLRDTNSCSVHWEPVQRASSDTKIKLPSSVFASEVEEDVGLLNKAAPHPGPRLDMDPDIVAAMDEDFDYEDPENELEDNFIELANEGSGDDEQENMNYNEEEFGSEGEYDSEENDEVRSLNGPQFSFADEETKSHFTSYSMSSSVIRRNDQLTLLDDCFEQMFMNSYGDSEIGALDCEEIEGHVAPDSAVVLQCVAETEKQNSINRPILEPDPENDRGGLDAFQDISEDEEDDHDNLVYLKVQEKEKWDCESILSTYSNLYNRPKIIPEPMKTKITVSGKTGIPLGVINGGGSMKLTERALAKHNNDSQSKSGLCDETASLTSALSILSVRPKDEKPEEKLLRKKALREYRKERRLEKKVNTLAFKDEKKKQEKIMLNNRTNIKGIHMT